MKTEQTFQQSKNPHGWFILMIIGILFLIIMMCNSCTPLREVTNIEVPAKMIDKYFLEVEYKILPEFRANWKYNRIQKKNFVKDRTFLKSGDKYLIMIYETDYWYGTKIIR